MTNESAADVASPSLPRGLAGFRQLLAWIGRVELILAIAALVVVVALSTAQAFLRYLFGISLWWAQEVAELTVLITYFLGISYVFKTRQEIYIEFLSSILPVRFQLGLYMMEQVITCIFALVLLWLIYLFTPTMFNLQSPVLKLPGGVTYIPLLLSTASIIVTSLYYLAFGLWAHRRKITGQVLSDIEMRGLILRPWVDLT